MTYEEVLDQAKQVLYPTCKVCRVCNGASCAGKVPGPGGKGSGSTALRNYHWLNEHVKLNQRVLHEPFMPTCEINLFGKNMSAPIFSAPIGMVELNWGPAMDEGSYAEAVVEGMRKAGSIAFTGGGNRDICFSEPLEAIIRHDGWGIPTLKPWRMELLEERLRLVEKAGVPAWAMDIDTAGLPHATASVEPMQFKSRADLERLVRMTKLPFLVKGIMTEEDAKEAADAGVYGIIVSNHGGRVMDEGLSTAEVLLEIRQAVGNRVKILVDGGIRTGAGVFKMLALGADAVMIGRPYSVAAYGGGAEGVKLYTERLREELLGVMLMTGCRNLEEIDKSCLRMV